jgi:hypothetical protein
MLNLVLSLTQYWVSIPFCPEGEILKPPMKRVQGMVQYDRFKKFQVCLARIKPYADC